ncbi:hypothetical protein [Roseovarius sp. 2305UL8-3]|uniref:hypothetical protein n=1 Tax=Roseovarius conchicola TaxID=3121636 RepID=UPI003527EC21
MSIPADEHQFNKPENTMFRRTVQIGGVIKRSPGRFTGIYVAALTQQEFLVSFKSP